MDAEGAASLHRAVPSPDLDARFEAVQANLGPLWEEMRGRGTRPLTTVVCPSLSFDPEVLEGLTGIQHYEERFLILCLLLRQPRERVIYITSMPVREEIVDYYVHLLPGVIAGEARRRLHMLSPEDGSIRPLTLKILERPRFVQKLKALIGDPARAHIMPFNTTRLEKELAVELGVPLYGADPRFLPFGTKSGCRKLFREEGVPHPEGFEDLHSWSEVTGAIAKLRAANPALRKALVKTNEGVSGLGNLTVDLSGLPEPGDTEEPGGIERRVMAAFNGPFESYLSRLTRGGGVVEEVIEGERLRSPSVQMSITPSGQAMSISTHDQLLGGRENQTYIGCRFPADRGYALRITQEAEKLGRRLAAEGVIGRLAVDFVVTRNGAGAWRPYAIEINLRRGGTTHPFLALQLLTGGHYNPDEAGFVAPNSRKKFFIASDHVESEHYKGLTVGDLFTAMVQAGLHFDHALQKGVVLHMMSAVSELGRTGLTAIGDSSEEADSVYKAAVAALDAQAAGAFIDNPTA